MFNVYGKNKEKLYLKRAEILLNIILYQITKQEVKNKEYTEHLSSGGQYQTDGKALINIPEKAKIIFKKKACVMKHRFSFIKIPKLFPARDIYQERKAHQ